METCKKCHAREKLKNIYGPTDTDRMEWLEQHRVIIDHSKTAFDDCIWSCDGGNGLPKSVRAMIDEQMAKEKKK